MAATGFTVFCLQLRAFEVNFGDRASKARKNTFGDGQDTLKLQTDANTVSGCCPVVQASANVCKLKRSLAAILRRMTTHLCCAEGQPNLAKLLH